MTRIVIEPKAIELGLHKDEYKELVHDLEAQGHKVELRRPVQERSATSGFVHDLEAQGHKVELRRPVQERSATSGFGQVAYAVAVYLGEFVEEHVLDAVVGAFIARLVARRRDKPPPRVAIYGPDRRVMREVDLPQKAARDE